MINDLEYEELIENYPNAVSVKPLKDTPYLKVFGKDEMPLGYLVLSEDITSLKGYSGTPINIIIGIDNEGIYQSVKIIEHSEPIVLIGLPESTLTDFVEPYQNHHINEPVTFGDNNQKQQIKVDAISGATVTALVINETIRTSVAALGMHLGLLIKPQAYKGEFINEVEAWTWDKMIDEKVFGQLQIKSTDFDPGAEHQLLSNIWYTLADAPQIGKALLGERRYKHYMQSKAENSHILVVFSLGDLSFKGSGFARGGIFDRFRLEQGQGGSTSATIFRDSDYENMPQSPLVSAPKFTEGGIFITPEDKLNPAIDFEFIFLASQHEMGSAYKRQFKSFKSSFRLPESIYHREKVVTEEAESYWLKAWKNKPLEIIITIFLLVMFVTVFTLIRRSKITSVTNIKKFQNLFYIFAVIIFGFYLNGQLSVVNVLTVVQFFQGDIEFTLFLTDPVIYIIWTSTFILILFFGRGMYCGWLCPFGALTELIFRAGQFLGIKKLKLPERLDGTLVYVKYCVLIAVVFSFLFVSNEWGYVIAEIEPFKYTFTVLPWTQDVFIFCWWAFILLASLFYLKPFCRYICPLGAFFVITSFFSRFMLPRASTCLTCNTCYKGCEYNAIKKNGEIDHKECTLCLVCLSHLKGHSPCPDYKLRKGFHYHIDFEKKPFVKQKK
ncbi:MAG: 4Fe-4S binding protein [Gammaproteobacteria bacterium]|nr:4Fe-4S binding protein [Gammaproteobacteria bacterium]